MRSFPSIESLFSCLVLICSSPLIAQQIDPVIGKVVQRELLSKGLTARDMDDLVRMDRYSSHNGALVHTFLRQRHNGIEVFNGDIAVHTRPNGELIALNNGAVMGIAEKATSKDPSISAQQAIGSVLQREGLAFSSARLEDHDGERRRSIFTGISSTYGPVIVQLMYLPLNEKVFLVWDVEFQLPDGSHWWKVRVDATTGVELERNDLVAQCSFDHGSESDRQCSPVVPFVPAAPNDYNVYARPLESPNHGPRSLQNAPWNAAFNASPYGWHDTNGVPGAEYTITRGNNVYAQEDQNGNNGTGYSPNGTATLDFDHPIDLTQPPNSYTDAAVTNLFYWNNILHDVLYQYGFDEQSGNFQSNNYGNGGLGNDHVLADAQDGSGSNNANFGTPPDGSNPRMQMFLWTGTPQIDGDLDNGIIAHEYGHGVSNRLVGGPSNTSCLTNAEQMGEGWSDLLGIIATMEPGDMGPDARGFGTFAKGQAITGPGLRPAPYSTSLSVNSYTYGNTNSGLIVPHGIGFVWCTMLWDMTWDLIGQYGFDPDIYNGSGGNNIALRLVIDGMKLTPCSPGFVDARDAILLADQLNNGGANQMLIWGAFARRGLGYSASQGSSQSRSDQLEAFDIPVNINATCTQILSPAGGTLGACSPPPSMVKAIFRNNGIQAIQNLPVSYSLDGGPPINEIINGSILIGEDTTYTFVGPLSASPGPHLLQVWSATIGEAFPMDDTLSVSFNIIPNNGSVELILKPGPNEGKDASVWFLTNQSGVYGPTNSTNYGNDIDIQAMEWTYAGSVGRRYGLVGFDLEAIPTGSTVQSAALSLFANPVSADGGHSSLSGSNSSIVQRITSSWDEHAVTWNTRPSVTTSGQVILPQSSAPDQDYIDIDVTTMVIDMVQDLPYGHGFQLSTITPQNYRKMIFSSSDHPNPLKWPQLKVCYVPPAQLVAKVLLDGPWSSTAGLMHDSLRVRNMIPLSEPYTGLGFVQTGGGGGEIVTQTVLNSTGPDAIVDWVYVALSSSGAIADIVATRSALLQRDGDVVDVDGVSPVGFAIPNGLYHVIVKHRNHLGAVTSTPFSMDPPAPLVDFTMNGSAAYGVGAQKLLGIRYGLWAGDVNQDDLIKYTGSGNDRDPILLQIGGIVATNTVSGYLQTDVNMDGTVKYTGNNNDRDPILVNIGGVVATNIRAAQFP